MKALKTNVVKTLLVASAVVLSPMSVVNAASQCKGLDNAECNSNSACGWVESYQRYRIVH